MFIIKKSQFIKKKFQFSVYLSIDLTSSGDPRALDMGQVWSEGAAPGTSLAV